MYDLDSSQGLEETTMTDTSSQDETGKTLKSPSDYGWDGSHPSDCYKSNCSANSNILKAIRVEVKSSVLKVWQVK